MALAPTIGQWYYNAENGQLFEVVALDASSTNIEIQYLDGAIDEFDREDWRGLLLQLTAPPEDPASAFESGLEESDLADAQSTTNYPFFNVDTIESELFPGTEEF